MTDWTAITGIVVSGVVGPTTAAILARMNLVRGQRHDREMTDLRELRSLLSEAGADLREAEGLRAVAASALMTHGRSVRERAPEVLESLQAGGRRATLQGERISLLLGRDHPVACAHREVVDLVTTALQTLMLADLEGRGDERIEEWKALHDQKPAQAARLRFIEESNRLVGSRVVSARRRRLLSRSAGSGRG